MNGSIGTIDDLIARHKGDLREAEAYCWKMWESAGKPEHSAYVATAIAIAERFHGVKQADGQ
jgi:hypothetical protein